MGAAGMGTGRRVGLAGAAGMWRVSAGGAASSGAGSRLAQVLAVPELPRPGGRSSWVRCALAMLLLPPAALTPAAHAGWAR